MKVPPLPEKPKNILIIKLSSIGDVIQALPVAAALRRRFPQTRLTWLVRDKAKEVVLSHPYLSQVLVVGGDGRETPAVPDFWVPHQVAHVLRPFGFDVCLDIQGQFRSGLFARLSGARWRIGWDRAREINGVFNNLRIVPNIPSQHVVRRYLQFATALGAETEPIDFGLRSHPSEDAMTQELLAQLGHDIRRPLAALIPGASWRAKCWPAERFGMIAHSLNREHGFQCLVVGGLDDKERAAIIARAAGSDVLDATGRTTIRGLIPLLRRCVIAIGNDTGPTHLAAALGLPVVGIYGPTAPEKLGPFGEKNECVFLREVPCRPCQSYRIAERCSHNDCLQRMEPGVVWAAVERVLEGARRSASRFDDVMAHQQRPQ